jgi:hypothetical protein
MVNLHRSHVKSHLKIQIFYNKDNKNILDNFTQ